MLISLQLVPVTITGKHLSSSVTSSKSCCYYQVSRHLFSQLHGVVFITISVSPITLSVLPVVTCANQEKCGVLGSWESPIRQSMWAAGRGTAWQGTAGRGTARQDTNLYIPANRHARTLQEGLLYLSNTYLYISVP